MRYQLLLPKETRSAPFKVTFRLRCNKMAQIKKHQEDPEFLSEDDLIALRNQLAAQKVATRERSLDDNDQWLLLDESRTGDALNEALKDTVADMVSAFMESVTPVVSEITENKTDQ